jgi:DNA mismatch repair protein MutL
MKSVSSEAQGCRQSFLDKALPHPRTGFRFFADGALKVYLPAQELKERVAAAYALDPVHLLAGEGESAVARIRTVAGRPELVRQDRRLIQVFVNRRRVSDFSLVQAVEYAYGEHVPGGAFPIAFVFLEVDPAQVDFNIHPAKKEVRFRNLGELRQLLIGALRGPLAAFNLSAGVQRKQPPAAAGSLPLTFDLGQPPGLVVRPGVRAAPAGEPGSRGAPREREVVYHGQVFRLFLLAERGDSLFLIDQHAAHERLLFEELLAHPLAPQELLLPVPLAGVQESLVLSRREAWGRLGIRVERGEGGNYAVTALPEELLCLEEELADALSSGIGSPEELRQSILSQAACRSAVKDGEEVDPLTASELVRRALELDNARCPHGRPLWMEVRRSDLWKTVGRP